MANIDIKIKINATILNMTGLGLTILLKDTFINWSPTNITITDTIRADKYSTLPCPKGCSSSAGLPANLNPTIVIIEEIKSERLLNPSAIIDILFVVIPVKSFIKNNRELIRIPTIPPR